MPDATTFQEVYALPIPHRPERSSTGYHHLLRRPQLYLEACGEQQDGWIAQARSSSTTLLMVAGSDFRLPSTGILLPFLVLLVMIPAPPSIAPVVNHKDAI